MRTCIIDGCEAKHLAKGYCRKHYNEVGPGQDRHKVTRNCDECGREYTTTRSNGKYCSLDCRDAVMKREKRGVYRDRPKIPEPFHSTFKVWIVTCTQCGAQFNAKRGDAKYCSPTCRGHGLYGAGWIPQSERQKAALTCPQCGREFKSKYWGKLYCSSHCQREAARDRGATYSHGAWISVARRLRLYRRDHYICYICGMRTNRLADPSADLDAPTLDHVIPRSKGGTDDDSNLRCCCRRCNSLKSDAMLIEEQLTLDLAS